MTTPSPAPAEKPGERLSYRQGGHRHGYAVWETWYGKKFLGWIEKPLFGKQFKASTYAAEIGTFDSRLKAAQALRDTPGERR